MPTSGARKASGALSGPKARFHAQKTTPKATPRTAVTTMSTVRQRVPAAAGSVASDGGRTAESAMIPPDSLRRHDPDQVRGSAVARTLSAEALPCRFLLLCAHRSPASLRPRKRRAFVHKSSLRRGGGEGERGNS